MSTSSVTVSLTPSDFAAAERYVADSLRRRGRWFWLVRLLNVTLGALLALGFLGLLRVDGIDADLVSRIHLNSGLLFGALALVPVINLVHRRSVRGVLFSPGSRLLAPYTLSIGEEFVTVNSPTGRAELTWSAIEPVERNDDYLFLFTQPDYAIVVPARAFATREQFLAFADRIALMVAGNAR